MLDDSVRSIALMRPRVGLGDLLCTVPALRALRARMPRARVVLVTFAETAPVVERMARYVDELMPFPGWPGIPERPVRRSEVGPFLARARARRFDLAVQMYGASRAADAATAALGARRTAGFTGRPREPHRFLPYPRDAHEVDRQLALVRLLGADGADRALEFPVNPVDDADAAAVRRRAGIAGRPYALVHPGATSPSRRWPLGRWARAADALAARGLAVAFTGVRGEQAAVQEARRRMRAPSADLCGLTPLGTLASLVRDAALLVGNDSGPAHLAAAVGTPTVTVFLSGDPIRWAHPGGRHRVARAQVECNPCPHLTCPIDHRCATAVTVERVVGEVDAVLGTVRA